MTRDIATIRAELDRVERCIDVLIRQVTQRNFRPDRTWAVACTAEQKRADELRAELQAVLAR